MPIRDLLRWLHFQYHAFHCDLLTAIRSTLTRLSEHPPAALFEEYYHFLFYIWLLLLLTYLRKIPLRFGA